MLSWDFFTLVSLTRPPSQRESLASETSETPECRREARAAGNNPERSVTFHSLGKLDGSVHKENRLCKNWCGSVRTSSYWHYFLMHRFSSKSLMEFEGWILWSSGLCGNSEKALRNFRVLL